MSPDHKFQTFHALYTIDYRVTSSHSDFALVGGIVGVCSVMKYLS